MLAQVLPDSCIVVKSTSLFGAPTGSYIQMNSCKFSSCLVEDNNKTWYTLSDAAIPM